jgi:steroid 5-alpha reductase family enzyme
MVSKLTDVLGILNTEFLNSFHCFVLQPPPLALSVCFYSHSPVIMSLWLCIVFIVYSFVWSVLSGNCSKVDQIWSITPCLYSWVFYLYHTGTHGHGGAIHYRLLLVCSLISFWGIRLTYNFWRRGKHTPGEGSYSVIVFEYRRVRESH